MKNKHYSLFIGFFLLVLPQISRATHIVGGEMNYRCLGNDQYEIQLTIFRDCDTGVPDFDDPASIGVFALDAVTNSYFLDTGVGQMGQLLIPKMNDDTLNPVLSDPCKVVPPNVCVNTSTYTDTISLPFREGGYTLAYQRCCRNQSILNIIDPLDTGATYPIEISETALIECNSNAVFNEWPPIYICVNDPIDFDHSATDIDGDSLVYKLCTPFEGATPDLPMPQPPNLPPFTEVTWINPPYNLSNMMGGIPLAIDSQTGFLTGVPNTIGQFVVGICVEEYKNGDLISTTRRDFQYNVGVCGEFVSSFFVPEVSCEGLEVTFDDQSINALSNNPLEYNWSFNDPGNSGAGSTLSDPIFIYSDTGTYTVQLAIETQVTAPNGTFLCTDTSFATFSVYEPSLFPEFTASIVDCNEPINIDFINNSSDTVFNLTDWQWTINNTLFSISENPPTFISDDNEQEFEIELIITNEKGCLDTTTQIIDIGIDLEYSNSISTCEPVTTFNLDVNVLGNPDITSWVWEPTAGIISGGNTNTPSVDLTIASTYYFSVVYADGCVFEDSIEIDNSGLDLGLNITSTPDTLNDGQSSQLEVTGNNLDSYVWEPTGSLDDPTIFNPIASPVVSTEYTTFVTDINGCVDTISILVVVLSTICEEPYLFMPNAFTPNGDSENDVLFVEGNVIDEMYLAIYNRWGEKVFESKDKSIGWDGIYKNELLEPDVYGYYLTIKCVNGEEYFKKGNINLIR